MVSTLDRFFEQNAPIGIIKEIATYDFRKEYNEEGYVKIREVDGVQFHSDLLLSEDPIDRFVAYKIFTQNPCKFDADNSLGTCRVMGEIYNKLWMATTEYSNFVCIKDYFDMDGKKVLFGGDVYNSMQTSIGLSKDECIQKYIKDLKDPKEPNELKKLLSDMQEVMEVSHVLGNFGLVPAYYNGYRGMSKTIRDYLDRSLKELSQNGFRYLDILIEKNRSAEKEKDSEAFRCKKESQYRDFEVNDYIKYINLMFLWDMHIEGKPVRDISSSIKKWKEIVPVIIRRRSLFMAMMLFFSRYREEVYGEMLSKIVNAESILNYESVFALLAEVEILEETDLKILESVKVEILRNGINVNLKKS